MCLPGFWALRNMRPESEAPGVRRSMPGRRFLCQTGRVFIGIRRYSLLQQAKKGACVGVTI